MIPAPFDYVRASSVSEAVQALADAGDDAGNEATILAGGQSLLPMMKLRLAAPRLVVDIGRIDELRFVRREGDVVAVGAATPYVDIVTADVIRQSVPLLARVTAVVADPQVRYRGTIGGSLAHADPAADLPAAVLALDGVMVATGPHGSRSIAAADFFVDYFTTGLHHDEVLTEVRIPVTGAEQYWYERFTTRSAGWAVVAVAVAGTRIGLAGMGPTPLRAQAAERALEFGGDAAAASELSPDGTDPTGDPDATPEYRRHLTRVLTYRALLGAQRR